MPVLTTDLIQKVKDNLNITDSTKDTTISDMIQEVMNYCNQSELTEALEPFIRRKVQGVINYEAENGTGTVFDIKSLHEGDTTVNYNVDDKTSKETIYGLSEKDKASLKLFRRRRK